MQIKDFEQRVEELNEKTGKEETILKKVDVELEPCFNMIKFGQAFSKFTRTENYEEYAAVVLPMFVISPKEFQKLDTFIHDFAALDDILGVIAQIMEKKQLAQPKRKSYIFQEDQTYILKDKIGGIPT